MSFSAQVTEKSMKKFREGHLRDSDMGKGPVKRRVQVTEALMKKFREGPLKESDMGKDLQKLLPGHFKATIISDDLLTVADDDKLMLGDSVLTKGDVSWLYLEKNEYTGKIVKMGEIIDMCPGMEDVRGAVYDWVTGKKIAQTMPKFFSIGETPCSSEEVFNKLLEAYKSGSPVSVSKYFFTGEIESVKIFKKFLAACDKSSDMVLVSCEVSEKVDGWLAQMYISPSTGKLTAKHKHSSPNTQ